jgi:hypothetical protein
MGVMTRRVWLTVGAIGLAITGIGLAPADPAGAVGTAAAARSMRGMAAAVLAAA